MLYRTNLEVNQRNMDSWIENIDYGPFEIIFNFQIGPYPFIIIIISLKKLMFFLFIFETRKWLWNDCKLAKPCLKNFDFDFDFLFLKEIFELKNVAWQMIAKR